MILSISVYFSKALSTSATNILNSIAWLIIILGITILSQIISYRKDLNSRKDFAYINNVQIKVEQSATILKYLLPEFVRRRVKNGIRYIAENKGIVTIIFIDICEFDKIINIYSSNELICFLDDVFTRFDKLCENFGVNKIETVGKTYLACAGLKDSESGLDHSMTNIPHARRAVELALALIQEIDQIQLKDGSFLSLKIGINSGPVTAGVVGYHKPQFSLVGDAVNTASRMSSTLDKANSIQISTETYELLGDTKGLNFVDRSPEVKGKGIMQTKIVERVSHFNEDLNFTKVNRPVSSVHLSPYNIDPVSEDSGNYMNNLFMNLEINNETDLLLQPSSSNNTLKETGFFLCLEKNRKPRLALLENNPNIVFYGLCAALAINGVLIVIEIIKEIITPNDLNYFRLVILIVEETFVIVFMKYHKKNNEKLSFALGLGCLYSLEFFVITIPKFYDTRDIIIENMHFYYRFLLLNFFTGLLFTTSLYFNIPVIILWLSILIIKTPFFSDLSCPLLYITLILVTTYFYEHKQRISIALRSISSKELENTEQLLYQMMPPHALKNLKDETNEVDRLNEVTLMYADIVGFTAWSSKKEPQEVVGMLSELFTRFDKMCLEYNVYKVHTIGDCYVAMGFVDDINRNPAKEAVNVINFARSLISVIEETNIKCQCNLGMRIGIHTGDIIGAITGTKIVRYDIYGHDALIANKMESNGQQGKIVVSENTKKILEENQPEKFVFNPFKEIYVSALLKTIKIFLVGDEL